jgi:hypothetical protein
MASVDWQQRVEAELKAAWLCWIHLTNRHKSPMVVYIEPWGEDYTLLPDEAVQLLPIGNSCASYLNWVQNADGCIQVYAEGDCTSIVVYQDGTELSCGHQRQVQCGGA